MTEQEQVQKCPVCGQYPPFCRGHTSSFTGPGLDGAVVKTSPVPVVVEPAPVRYGFTGGNVA